MTYLTDLSTTQLHQIIAIKERIEALQGQLDSVAGGGARGPGRPRGKRKMSAAARAKIAAAQRARWAKIKGGTATPLPRSAKKGKRRLSAAGRAAIIAATKARWARVKGAMGTLVVPQKRGKVSARLKAKLAAIARARWGKVGAEGKTNL